LGYGFFVTQRIPKNVGLPKSGNPIYTASSIINYMNDNPKEKSSYPETLFHICKELSTIKNILSDKAFIPSFAREFVNVNNIETPYYWVPMVSFCDFKVSELNLHLQKYGKFGIGVSKDWGIQKGLNPVLYLSQGCPLFGDVRQAIIEIDKVHNSLAETPHDNEAVTIYRSLSENLQTILKIYCYTKNYQGVLDRNEKLTENFRFADDREWRYVPDIDFQLYGCNIQSPTQQQKKDKKARLNETYINKDNFLYFEYSDIKFILVTSESESVDLIKFIENEISLENEIKLLLISKILIVEHLEL
jgi:hypothetical protein